MSSGNQCLRVYIPGRTLVCKIKRSRWQLKSSDTAAHVAWRRQAFTWFDSNSKFCVGYFFDLFDSKGWISLFQKIKICLWSFTLNQLHQKLCLTYFNLILSHSGPKSYHHHSHPHSTFCNWSFFDENFLSLTRRAFHKQIISFDSLALTAFVHFCRKCCLPSVKVFSWSCDFLFGQNSFFFWFLFGHIRMIRLNVWLLICGFRCDLKKFFTSGQSGWLLHR